MSKLSKIRAAYALFLATQYNWHVTRDKDPFLALWSVILLSSLLFAAVILLVLVFVSPLLDLELSQKPRWAVISVFFVLVVVPNALIGFSHRQEINRLQTQQNGPKWLWQPRWLMSFVSFVITLVVFFSAAAWYE